MLFQITVNVERVNKARTDVRTDEYVGFVDVRNPREFISMPWMVTKAKTLRDHRLDDAIPMDVAKDIARNTDKWLFGLNQEAQAYSTSSYNRSQKMTVFTALTVNRLSIPRVTVLKPNVGVVPDGL